jgi:nicotinate-nucleotide adenylyltransferase
MNAPAQVALFGTSADPPTLGHRALLQALGERYPLVRTWASGNPRIQVDQSLSHSRALHTLEQARVHWPEADLIFVVGSDLLPQIPRWYAADALLAACRLAVVPRLGWPLDALQINGLVQRGARVELLPLQIPATASSQLRLHPDPQLIPAELWPELRKRNLYGLGDGAASLWPATPPRR